MKYLIIATLILAFLIWIFWPRHLHCSDFQTQADAQRAYEKGSKQLDGYDHDGKACEALPKTILAD